MDNMDIDSPAEPKPLKRRDRVLRRLAQLGVPREYLERQCPGIVAFVMDNPTWIPDLVSAILPSDEDVAENLLETKARSKKVLNPTMKQHFRECMFWLQWMMFLCEPAIALKNLSKISIGRGVCGAVWGKNDIAYRCRACAQDPTCAICVPCFQNGNHKDHDYSIIYTGQGCCDCGDVTAWKQEGFCSKHKGAEKIQPLPEEFANSVGPVLDSLFICWKNKLVSAETICKEKPRTNDNIFVLKKVANELTYVVVEMLLEFCKQSESLLSFVSRRVISLVGLLEILVRSERFLSEGVARKLNELLLKLLGEPIFKYEFGKVFLSYYPLVVHEVIKEGTNDTLKKYPLLPTFSVQIFTVPTLTPRLVKEMNLLAMLLRCLGDIFIHCAGEDGRLQVTKWGALRETTSRVVKDIQFVMSYGIVPKFVINDQRDILRTWVRLLSFLQGMSPLKRENGQPPEEENDNINLPFVLDHSIANIRSLLVDGAFFINEEMDIFSDMSKQNMDEEDSTRLAKVGQLSKESSVCGVSGRNSSVVSAMQVAKVKSDSVACSSIPSSVTWLIYDCLRAIDNWLGANHTYGAVSSSNTGSSSNSNFLALKKTLSKISKGKYVFGGFTCSNEDHSRQGLPPGYIGFCKNMGSGNIKNTGYDFETVDSVDNDTATSDESLMEADTSLEEDALHILSSSDWPNIIYDISSQDVSVHIPLHRLLSLLLQKALRWCYGESEVLSTSSASILTSSCSIYDDDFFGHVLSGCHPYGFSAFVMEHPLHNRVFCAQVHAGMWRKNGDAAILSSDWYRSVQWSEQGLELDLFLMQCCAALAPADLYVNRIIECFGLSDYHSLTPERSSEYEPVLLQEMFMLIIQIVQERRFSGLTPAENLKRELVHKLAIGDATRSELVKFLPCDLSKCEQLQEILDSVAVYSNPSGFNQGLYSLRWTYWKELDLYHPRWNSRDLQVAEERYMRYCGVSALTTQLPRWTRIHPPLKGVARIATCKVVLKIIRAVIFYAVFYDKLAETRAPDDVLIMALHMLSLGLDICFQQREPGDMSFFNRDSITMLAFACEEIHDRLNYGSGEQSLLSLLVLLMRMHQRKNVDNFLEADSCNFSSLIESLLKRFAEVDSGCMAELQQLAPEVVIHLSQSLASSVVHNMGSASDSEKRKAKARERQAAMLAKMKAEQSKFLSSINSAVDDDSKCGLDETNRDKEQDLEEFAQDVCSLCHDPNSKNPVSFVILLQKSKLLSLIDRRPPSWDQVQQLDKEQAFINTKKVTDQAGTNTSSSGTVVISSNQFARLVENAINEFADYAQPGETSNFLESVETQFPSLRNAQAPSSLKNGIDRTAYTLEILEQDMYIAIRKEMNDNILFCDSGVKNAEFSADEGGLKSSSSSGSVLLGKYLAAFSRERTEHPSSSEDTFDDIARMDSTSQVSTCDGFGPADCDGVYLSSCGHTVHQGCLDRYLSSLKERYVRRIVFEGGHIVDPDQGEFLCPVCRRLANSVLPMLPGDFQRFWMEPKISTVASTSAAGHLSTSIEESKLLWLQKALTLLQSAANFVEKEDIWKIFPLQRNERMKQNLDSISHVLFKMYFPSTQDKFSRSMKANYCMIMWDTLKYSLKSMEIAARCGRTYMTPTYGLDGLYKELKSSGGFILSLLLKIVHSLMSKNSLHVLHRFRGIQLFAESICSGVSMDRANSAYGCEGDMSSILKHVEKEVPYAGMQFWKQASDPILTHDAFSSLMWILFCLPHPFLSCEESLLSLVHTFYIVSITQAILTSCGQKKYTREPGFHDCLITDISKVLEESGWIQQYFVSKNMDTYSNTMDVIRRLSFPYLRRCVLLWELLSTSFSEPFCNRDHVLHAIDDDTMDYMNGGIVELNEVQKLEKIFKIPPLDVVVKDQGIRSLVMKWLHHFHKEYEVFVFQSVLHSTPAVPFKLMQLPHLYQDLLERYIKQRCADCKSAIDEPALCLLCGRLCSPIWKPCCRSCQLGWEMCTQERVVT
ncbi:E3 ubiquitin-protein ligase PRT6 isoform X2 [Hevea brasiliensis]|uniref:E3 ubiquitin-protein ligase PRT6 isoform X2 n=1 Tax=Hevea brasiliensis TaxID=3981 RepID=UPI0025E58834|nr:E3 ubiquitin-protein ligase PRT6 isoform X2 [Hevea brasiliensis]